MSRHIERENVHIQHIRVMCVCVHQQHCRRAHHTNTPLARARSKGSFYKCARPAQCFRYTAHSLHSGGSFSLYACASLYIRANVSGYMERLHALRAPLKINTQPAPAQLPYTQMNRSRPTICEICTIIYIYAQAARTSI